MVKLKEKFNSNDEFVGLTLKGLELQHVTLIRSILNHVRLGQGDVYKEAAYELMEAIDKEFDQEEWWDDCLVQFSIEQEVGGVYGVIEAKERDYPEESCSGCMGCSGSCSGSCS